MKNMADTAALSLDSQAGHHALIYDFICKKHCGGLVGHSHFWAVQALTTPDATTATAAAGPRALAHTATGSALQYTAPAAAEGFRGAGRERCAGRDGPCQAQPASTWPLTCPLAHPSLARPIPPPFPGSSPAAASPLTPPGRPPRATPSCRTRPCPCPSPRGCPWRPPPAAPGACACWPPPVPSAPPRS